MTTNPSDPPDDIAAVRADIEATRAELSDTVDALNDKLNVKRNVQRRAHDVAERAEPHRTEIIAGLAVVAVLVTVIVWRRRRSS
jgi:Protein of unknown function (DUF3618)